MTAKMAAELRRRVIGGAPGDSVAEVDKAWSTPSSILGLAAGAWAATMRSGGPLRLYSNGDSLRLARDSLMRADARRNRELLVAAAIAAFTEHGADASLDDIARRAGVGPGTLYRHFPTRQALQEAAYLEGVQALGERAYALAETLPPEEALAEWMRGLADYLATKRGLSAALMSTLDKSSEIFVSTHKAIKEAASTLLDAAIATGKIRADVNVSDILKLVNGVGLACETMPDRSTQAAHLLSIVIAGLRA